MSPVTVGTLLVYLAFLAFYAAWSFFLAYHLLKFAPHRQIAMMSMALFVGISLLLLLVSVAAFLRLDWSAPVGLPIIEF